MYRRILHTCLALLLCCVSCSTLAANPTEIQLRKLERELLTAYVMLDFVSLERLYADDYTYIDDNGELLNKKQVVEMVRTAAFRVDSIVVTNSRIRTYGNTAIISGVRTFHRLGRILNIARYTEVWVNKNRRWQCVSNQLTSLPEQR
ncbi:MAG: nuclear transport factor 2 family protein [Bacteroidetes bacterium]|nr:nuclear transport factor 2 family protein [Bacteroidota bacterium]MCW5895582.1 nuclear transport factor 2 family protein [Bacteroidota bacterium]